MLSYVNTFREGHCLVETSLTPENKFQAEEVGTHDCMISIKPAGRLRASLFSYRNSLFIWRWNNKCISNRQQHFVPSLLGKLSSWWNYFVSNTKMTHQCKCHFCSARHWLASCLFCLTDVVPVLP